MKIPFAALGIAFDGRCLSCGAELTPEPDWGVARAYCKLCTIAHNILITVYAPPLARSRNGAILLDPLDAEYGKGTLPSFPTHS